MKHKLAQVPPIGSPRPYATHYFNRLGVAGEATKIGHCASRKGAVLAAVKRLATLDAVIDVRQNQIMRVEIFDDLGVCCNTVERRGEIVAVKGHY